MVEDEKKKTKQSNQKKHTFTGKSVSENCWDENIARLYAQVHIQELAA